jgi:glucose-6-phosphate 1-dehydrogenase
MENKLPLKIIIFGGTGDLVKKKIIPSIFDLYKNNFLDDNFEILGVSRKKLSDDDYKEWIVESLKSKVSSSEYLEKFIEKCRYFSADISNADTLRELSENLENQKSNNIYYLAVSPNLYENAFRNIAGNFMNPENGWDRVLVEKPFGNDLEHAKKLDQLLSALFQDEQIFRIDHYLAKETLQNILSFRFANSIFEPVWNSECIEEIKIKMYESFDVDNRASFYDGVGALRDVGQNHLLQMLALVTMEDPKNLGAENVRKARADLLENLEVDTDSMVRAQYSGYNEIPGIESETQTETFFSINAKIKNERWNGTKFNLTSGKSLNETRTEISVVFKEKWTSVCPKDDKRNYQNIITFNIQPEQKISVKFWYKKPGFAYDVDSNELSFDFKNNSQKISNAYEKVLFDAIKGDQTIFVSNKEIFAQWKFVEEVIKKWQNTTLLKYEKGIDPAKITSTI